MPRHHLFFLFINRIYYIIEICIEENKQTLYSIKLKFIKFMTSLDYS